MPKGFPQVTASSDRVAASKRWMMMNVGSAIARGFAATAVFAGLALGAAGPAWADGPTMSGSYNETSTSPDGHSVVTSWTVNPCASQPNGGCVWVKAGAGGNPAYFTDGHWVLDGMGDLSCADGSYHQLATTTHVVWDPDTMEGTNQITYIAAACGHPAGYTQTNKITIKSAS
jgi:hypothetical protein